MEIFYYYCGSGLTTIKVLMLKHNVIISFDTMCVHGSMFYMIYPVLYSIQQWLLNLQLKFDKVVSQNENCIIKKYTQNYNGKINEIMLINIYYELS